MEVDEMWNKFFKLRLLLLERTVCVCPFCIKLCRVSQEDLSFSDDYYVY